MSKLKVLTILGDKQPRENCRKIGDNYYLIGRDCIEIKGKYYKTSSPKITFDHETQKYCLLEEFPLLIRGIVGFEQGNPIFGHFTPNPYNNCFIGGIRDYYVIRPELLLENGYIENINDGKYYNTNGMSQSNILRMQTPKNVVDNRQYSYNAEDSGNFDLIKGLFDDYNTPMSKDVREYGRFLGSSTFGIELETIRGYLPTHIRNRLGLIVCRDGSLKDVDGTQGAEFVSVPMGGAKCLQSIRNMCNELSKRSLIDLNCSVHIHQGNLPTSRLYMAAIYILGLHIQDELFKMFPYYKTDPSGVKHKNYNQFLKSMSIGTLKDMSKEGYENYITGIYRKIFTFLSEGPYPDNRFNRKNHKHPHTAKWDRHSRYYWMNLMNLIFSGRNTVEYRPHPGSLNSQKIINWLFIINAISKYALVHAKDLITNSKPVKLEDVLNYYKDTFKNDRAAFLSEYLNAYVKERSAIFKKDWDNGDAISMYDLTHDSDYVFTYKNVSHLF